MAFIDRLKENNVTLYTTTCIIAIIPAVYFYMSKVQDIKDNELALRNDTQSLQIQLASHQKKQNTLPELKSQLEKRKQDLAHIEALLPNRVSVQKSLEIITRLSKAHCVILVSFDQRPEILSPERNYYQVPIDIVVSGTFKDLVLFYDNLTHTKQLIRLTNLNFTSTSQNKDDIRSTCSIILYRGL